MLILTMTLMAFSAQAQSCPDDNHPHAIDLGLPSGTRWACCNVGADKPEALGGYYAWGETEEKSQYDWDTYLYTDNDSIFIGEDIAGTEYDVAHVKWGGSWVMPSVEQIQELADYSTFVYSTMNDVKGARFTGSNGNTVFLPAAGMRRFGDIDYAGTGGNYWTSTLTIGYILYAYRLYYSVAGPYWYYDFFRQYGLSVRPVMSAAADLSAIRSDSQAHAVFNLYGMKVADSTNDLKNLPHGIYIVNGKKMVVD